MSMEKKYQIFISSTYNDLKTERGVVRDAILKLHQFPVGMEQFNAGDSKQWDIIKETIDFTDYYVLIIGKRYGSIITSGEDAGISYTEKEYDYAVSQNIPVFAFIKSDDASFRGDAFETDPEKQKKMASFIDKVKDNHTVEWFEDIYELAYKVATALSNAMTKNTRPGWVRGGQDDIEKKIDELYLLLKKELIPQKENDVYEDDDWDEPVTEYEFTQPRFPSDGKHKEIGDDGDPIGEGEYKKGKLVEGIEYDVLFHVTRGELLYKPDCPEDPYDSSEDFEYERLEFYGWKLSFRTFAASEAYIIVEGLDSYYVADFEVDNETEHMTNIRTLREFLLDRDPERLEELIELIEEAKIEQEN